MCDGRQTIRPGLLLRPTGAKAPGAKLEGIIFFKRFTARVIYLYLSPMTLDCVTLGGRWLWCGVGGGGGCTMVPQIMLCTIRAFVLRGK